MNLIQQKLVSIVIPCYQQIEFLHRAVNSCIKQSHSNIEILIVDDGNEDPITRKDFPADPRVKLIRQENKGLSSARNTGIAKAEGDYIKFLDADDWLLPDCIETQLSSLGASTDTLSIIGYCLTRDNGGTAQPVIPKFGDFFDGLAAINIGPPHIFLYPTALVKEAGGFSTSDKVRGGHEDYDFNLRLALNGVKVVTCHSIGCYYFVHEQSMSNKVESMRVSRGKVLADVLSEAQAQSAELSLFWLVSALTGALKYGFYDLVKNSLTARIEEARSRTDESLGHIELKELIWMLLRCRQQILQLPSARNDVLWIEHVLASLYRRYRRTERFYTDQNILSSCYSVRPFELSERQITSIVNRLQQLAPPNKLLLWGEGAGLKRWLKWVELAGVNNCIGTSKDIKESKRLEGVPYLPLNDIELTEVESILICSESYYWEIIAFLRSLKLENKVIDIYSELNF
ncbi:glycosyltransferase family 2 protein [Alteromonas gilva]|uniref:Glycosyltransferase family A protein n=1 Tax=Alteromonas gilva TaxID=2987522 RepID=A0ABT5L1W8_9ALTE|nr:glycosyltransferase family A protein [Alteromonas gilva]MDC8830471.1 glycosyltransferase family A protein [Alteromonas gilva]